jgi:hypothetical protein
MATVRLTPLSLSPVGRGNFPSQRREKDFKLTPMPYKGAATRKDETEPLFFAKS